MSEYRPGEFEEKWRERWEREGVYRSVVDWNRPKHYALTMLPYPSGDLHIGHWYAMTPSDTRARFMRMKGFNVLFPMGFDAFGLPAENAAVQRNIDPVRWTADNIAQFFEQLLAIPCVARFRPHEIISAWFKERLTGYVHVKYWICVFS